MVRRFLKHYGMNKARNVLDELKQEIRQLREELAALQPMNGTTKPLMIRGDS